MISAQLSYLKTMAMIEIVKIQDMLEEWNKNPTIEIDISTAAGVKKYNEVKKKSDALVKDIDNRLKGLKNKLVRNLNIIYSNAKNSISPYDKIVDAISAIATPSADLTSLFTFATDTLGVLNQFKDHYTKQYTEPKESMVAVITNGMGLAGIFQQLGNLQMPEIKIKDGGSYIPAIPTIPGLSISEIIGGQVEPEIGDTTQDAPKAQRQLYFTSYSELSNYPTTSLVTNDVALVKYKYTVNSVEKDIDRRYIYNKSYRILNKVWENDTNFNWAFTDETMNDKKKIIVELYARAWDNYMHDDFEYVTDENGDLIFKDHEVVKAKVSVEKRQQKIRDYMNNGITKRVWDFLVCQYASTDNLPDNFAEVAWPSKVYYVNSISIVDINTAPYHDTYDPATHVTTRHYHYDALNISMSELTVSTYTPSETVTIDVTD